ncbi:TadE/TadG family type IV pilus assembly protein [Aquimonas voraii]|uniref:TadE-like protein n=1 Tax=Aquimonas voraii TaxID=265719 RepID=A0A1G6WWR9_9GAMM|nr:TadE family protein [Aquimonas voraii]SDD69445.1 TadE-like protein [Aquimonas voraii]
MQASAIQRTLRARPRRGAEGGAVLVELYIILPIFALLMGGIFELSMLYRARAVLDAATFEAAQQGSLQNALLAPMQRGLAEGMAPHLLRGRTPAAVVQSLAEARGRMLAGGGGVRIISPNRAIFDRFAQRQTVRTTVDTAEIGQRVIPNDNLMWRSAAVQQVRVGNQNVPMTVQDANILKIESHWCERLKVPILDRVIARMVNGPLGVPAQCVGVKLADDARYGRPGQYIVLRSHSIARMQSPVLRTNLN